MKLTHERLLEVLHYDPDTGVFTRLTKTKIKVGYQRKQGYITISVDLKKHLAHRLAWLYIHGTFPKNSLDHINCIKSDNRIANLREATHAQNAYNTGMIKVNTSGFKGVFNARCGGYRACITHNNKQIHIGTFDTKEKAYEAYCKKAIELRGDFVRFK